MVVSSYFYLASGVTMVVIGGMGFYAQVKPFPLWLWVFHIALGLATTWMAVSELRSEHRNSSVD